MKDAFVAFEWSVAPRYEWQDWLDTDGTPQRVPPRLLAGLNAGGAIERAWEQAELKHKDTGPVLSPILKELGDLRRYHPMAREHAALFRDFAKIDYANPLAIQAFATKYGALGLQSKRQSLVIRDAAGSRRHHSASGESHFAWALEICRMREGLALAEHHGNFGRKRALKSLVDRQLREVRGRLAFDRAGEPRLVVEPLTLIGALWLQLASALTGGKRFVTCKFCRKFFEISTEETGFRSHREFCSDSCKTRDYRKRKRTAKQLAARGKTAASIADQVETATTTVKRWLAGTDARKKGKD